MPVVVRCLVRMQWGGLCGGYCGDDEAGGASEAGSPRHDPYGLNLQVYRVLFCSHCVSVFAPALFFVSFSVSLFYPARIRIKLFLFFAHHFFDVYIRIASRQSLRDSSTCSCLLSALSRQVFELKAALAAEDASASGQIGVDGVSPAELQSTLPAHDSLVEDYEHLLFQVCAGCVGWLLLVFGAMMRRRTRMLLVLSAWMFD